MKRNTKILHFLFLLSVCSFNPQIERSTSERSKKEENWKEKSFYSHALFYHFISSAGIFISFILSKFKNPLKQIAFDIVCTKNFNLRQWVFLGKSFQNEWVEIKRNKQLVHKIHKNAKKARRGGKRKFSIYLKSCQASTSKRHQNNNKKRKRKCERQKEK